MDARPDDLLDAVTFNFKARVERGEPQTVRGRHVPVAVGPVVPYFVVREVVRYEICVVRPEGLLHRNERQPHREASAATHS